MTAAGRPAGHRYFLFVRDSTVSYEARGVLGAMVDVGRPMSIADLAALSPDPESVVVDCLSELVVAGYVEDDPGGVYSPTGKAFETRTDEP